jgi:cell division protein FtsB
VRFVTLALVALLALVNAELWFGKGGVPRVMELQGKLAEQRPANDAARARNAQLDAEVRDLKEGPRDGRGEGALRARHGQAGLRSSSRSSDSRRK